MRLNFWNNLDKFMLAGFIVYFSLFAFLAVYGTPNSPVVTAMLDNEKTVLGAFLGLVTGRAMQRAQDAQQSRPPAAPKDDNAKS